MVLENGTRLASVKLAKTLASCPRLVCFLVTIGSRLDGEIKTLSGKRRLSSACVLDAMGSLLVERTIEGFQQKKARELRAQGMGVTLRFSPGYCDWPLVQQKELFGLFDAQGLGVRLSNSCLMTPRKSISGVFGLYPLDSGVKPYTPCWDCGRSNCGSRRAPRRESEPGSC